MDITFIGTGSAFNHADSNNSAFLEFYGSNMLLDCGPSVPRDFEVMFGSVSKIDNIWISHLHGDHIGGLEELGFKNYFMNGGKRPNLYIHESLIEKLKEYLAITMGYTTTGPISVDAYFNFIPIKDENSAMFTIDKTDFYVEMVDHICCLSPAFYLTEGTFIYTGDTKFIDWSKCNLKSIKAIFQDTQLHDYGNNVHTTLQELLTLPEDVRSKIWCMHYGPDITQFSEQIKNAGMKIAERWKKIKL